MASKKGALSNHRGSAAVQNSSASSSSSSASPASSSASPAVNSSRPPASSSASTTTTTTATTTKQHTPTPEEIKRQRGLEAQRAFRARKAAHLQELENKVAHLELENTRLRVENERLKEDNGWLKKEFEKLSEQQNQQQQQQQSNPQHHPQHHHLQDQEPQYHFPTDQPPNTRTTNTSNSPAGPSPRVASRASPSIAPSPAASLHSNASASGPSSGAAASSGRFPRRKGSLAEGDLTAKEAAGLGGGPAGVSLMSSSRYHPYGGGAVASASGASALAGSPPSYPLSSTAPGPALPRIMPRHAPSLPSINDSVFANLSSTYPHQSRLPSHHQVHHRPSPNPCPALPRYPPYDVAMDHPAPPSIPSTISFARRQPPVRGHSLPMPRPIFPEAEATTGSSAESSELAASVHVLNHSGGNTTFSTSPTSSSSSTIQPSSDTSSHSSAGGQANAAQGNPQGQEHPQPQRAPSLPLPPLLAQQSPSSRYDLASHLHAPVPAPPAPIGHHQNPPSSLTSLLLSPGRECSSPPSFHTPLPPAHHLTASGEDGHRYRDSRPRHAESMDSMSSATSSHDVEEDGRSRPTASKMPSLTLSSGTGTSVSSLSSSVHSNTNFHAFTRQYEAASLAAASPQPLHREYSLSDAEPPAAAASLPKPIPSSSSSSSRPLNPRERTIQKSLSRRGRNTIDDFYELFGERPEVKDAVDQGTVRAPSSSQGGEAEADTIPAAAPPDGMEVDRISGQDARMEG